MHYDLPYIKIASPSITDKELLCYCAATGKPLLLSTGMSDLALIHRAVAYMRSVGGKIACLYHCTSTYPGKPEELNLRGIQTLQREFPDIPIGYSGHEPGLPTSVMAAVLGAASIERHITLDRSMPGSDQAASLEPGGLQRLVRDIRLWERSRGDGVITVYDSEIPVRQKLRRRDSFDRTPAEEVPEQIAPPDPRHPSLM
jgi:N-acetylneuraminate synthase